MEKANKKKWTIIISVIVAVIVVIAIILDNTSLGKIVRGGVLPPRTK